MNNEQTYQGSCFCGAVEFTVTGEPVAMGYCHCESCRHWSGGPVNAFSLWNPEAISRLAGRLGTTKSRVIRDAVRYYQQHLNREELRQRIRSASLKTRAQALDVSAELDTADADGL